MVNLQNRSVMYVLTYAMHVPKIVENIVKWIIVSNVLKHIEDAQKNATRWPDDDS